MENLEDILTAESNKFDLKTADYENSAHFEDSIEDNPTREELTEKYKEFDTENLEFSNIIEILGWKYNLSNYSQYSEFKKTFLLKGKEATVEAFKEAFRNETSEILELLNKEFGEGVQYGYGNTSTGMTEITFSAYLLFLRQEPIFDQHTQRAMKHLHEKYGVVDTKGSTYNSYRESFYQLLDKLGWEENAESIHRLDKALFYKGRKLKEITTYNPNLNEFLSSRNENWVREISEDKEAILFSYLHQTANTPIDVTVNEALEHIDNEERGTSDLKDMILRQESDSVYKALTQIEVTGHLRDIFDERVEMEYSEDGTDSEPDLRLKTDESSFVIEVTDMDSVIRQDEAEDGEVTVGSINTTEGNSLGSKISNKLERQLKHFSSDHYTVLVICSESSINDEVLESHLLGNPALNVYTDKETGEPAGTEPVRKTPVINLDENSEHLDMIFHYNDATPEASLYASVGLDWKPVKTIAEAFGLEEIKPFRNDEIMDYEEWKESQ